LDHTTTRPPSPTFVASAWIVVPRLTNVRLALRSPPPWNPPPTSTSPPPVAPDASICASRSATRSPRTLTLPPAPAALLASTVPETATVPDP
jgi:hypothetical protein